MDKINGECLFGTEWMPAYISCAEEYGDGLFSCIVAYSEPAAAANVVSLQFILPQSRVKIHHQGFMFQKNLVDNQLLQYILRATEEDLCHYLSIIISAIEATPFWLNGFQSKLRHTLTQRIQINRSAEQFVCFHDAANSCDSTRVHDRSERSALQILEASYQVQRASVDMSDAFPLSPRAREHESAACVTFWEQFARQSKLSVGTMIQVPPNVEIYDPITPQKGKVACCKLLKVMKSKTKPLLLQNYVQGSNPEEMVEGSVMLLKAGDDMRQDYAVLQVFEMMNFIWAKYEVSYHGNLVQAKTYKVVPIGPDTGVIGFIPNCKCLKEIRDYEKLFEDEELDRLVATACGSYIASYILGVRDRHWDNVLIQDDGTCFHIDFGFCLGSKASFDAERFAVTKDMQKLLGDRWENFVDVCLSAFLVLKENQHEVIEYAKLIFNTHDPRNVQQFLTKTLGRNGDELYDNDKALQKIKKRIEASPNSWQTWVKNKVHNLAQKSLT